MKDVANAAIGTKWFNRIIPKTLASDHNSRI
jgi:hypothetical protein